MAAAYTYDDFVSAANKAGLMNSFDANDLAYAQKYPEYGMSMISLKRDLGNAKTNEQKLLATEAMNQLRKNYGSYWTGDSGERSYATSYGSKIADAMDKVNNYADYSSPYGSQISKALKDVGNYKDYSSEYAKQITDAQKAVSGYKPFQYSGQEDYKKLLDSVVNREAFSYDPETDPLYGSYKKIYNREGDRAVANALGQTAAATGGVPSSYAATAAAQAGNYYAAQLADMIPELRNQALNEYNNEFAQLLQALGAMDTDRGQEYSAYTDRYDMLNRNLQNLMALDETAYGRYTDKYNRLLQNLNALQGQDQTEYGRYTDRYNRLQQELQNLQGQDESDYKRYLDMLNAEYQRDRDAVADAQQEFANAIQIYQLTGQATGPLADLLASAEASAGGGGGGGGYGSGGGGGGGAKKSVNDLIGVTKESAKSGRVTVPAYINGKQTTKVVDADKARSETQIYLNTALRKGDIMRQEYELLSAELVNPGSTGPYAELASIEGDLRRGAITSAQAQQKRQKVLTEYYQQQEARKAAQAAQQQSAQPTGGGGGGNSTSGGDYSYYYQNNTKGAEKSTGGGGAAQNGSAGGGANRVNSLAANNAVGSRSFGTVKNEKYL